MELSMVPYRGEEEGGKAGGAAAETAAAPAARYWECMKNHAAGLGAQALDGCGEFMPGGEPGSLEALKCAACGCHRNFHRKEELGGGDYVPLDHLHHHHPVVVKPAAPFFRPIGLALPGYRPVGLAPSPSTGSETPPPAAPLLFSGKDRDRARKRFRTKFTPEQKEEMLKFAEKVGWRIQRHDNDELQEFCSKVGVKRQVLKVWMHNNKSSLAGSAPKSDPPSAPIPV